MKNNLHDTFVSSSDIVQKVYFSEKIFAHLFFFFFVAQIFSPTVAERTIYLETVIIICNPFFLIWLFSHKIESKYIYSFIGALIIIAFGQLVIFIKFLRLFILGAYLFYAEERKIFFIKPYIYMSILLGVFQFILLFIDIGIALQLGPTNLAKLVWGDYATATFTNFYTIFLFPRISGLSREAGFFSSLLVCVIFLNYIMKFRFNLRTSSFETFFLWLGYIISFSKMSLVLFPIILIERLKKFINHIPYALIIILFVMFMIVFWQANQDFLLDDTNATFLSRFSAYVMLADMDIWQLLFGIDNISQVKQINSPVSKAISVDYLDMLGGFGAFILRSGLLITIVICSILYMFGGITSSGILVLLLLTINVQIDTNQNFVSLAYYIIFKYYSEKRHFKL